MKRIVAAVMIAVMWCAPLYASFVNLRKDGTPWVWRVVVSDSTGFMLAESGGAWLLEDGEKITFQDGLTYDALYHALIGQGWTETTIPATIPQALTVAGLTSDQVPGGMLLESESLINALAEDGKTIITEDSKNLNLQVYGNYILTEAGSTLVRESIQPDPHSIVLGWAMAEDGRLLLTENLNNIKMEN